MTATHTQVVGLANKDVECCATSCAASLAMSITYSSYCCLTAELTASFASCSLISR